MILQITIGESICVSFDDDMQDHRPTPEVVEDYLIRMRRTAIDLFDGIPDDEVPALTEPEAEQS